MLFQITVLVAMSVVQSQAEVFCLEDSTCPENYFCETTSRVCRKCLDCKELNRLLPSNPGKCVKTDEDCGPCFIGWKLRPLNYGTLLYGAKCEPAEVKRMSKEIYIWGVGGGVFAGFLITVTFLRIFQNMSILKVVNNYYFPVLMDGKEELIETMQPSLTCEK